MADRYDRNPESVTGKYYVDLSCIDCDMCRHELPSIFARGDYTSKVWRQPESPEEEELCREAMANCPVEAIGDDGDG